MLPVNASMDCMLGETHVTAPAAVGLKRRYLVCEGGRRE
jgi:hypothetical protein